MPKNRPGQFNSFNGLWARGTADDCPPDHFTSCLNTTYVGRGFQKREGTILFDGHTVVRMHLYKPLPPYDANNRPRIIFLSAGGNVVDLRYPFALIDGNAAIKDFALVNFFGRAYLSYSDGKVGLNGWNVKVYDGSGNPARDAAGPVPATGAIVGAVAIGGNIDVGTYLISYAFETASGFITKPRVPFVGFDSFGGYRYDVTNIPVGPAGTVARWIVVTKAFPLATIGPLGGPYNVGLAEFTPLFFYSRIADNVTTVATVNFYDEQLVSSADYLWTQMSAIPAGVGLIDFNSRLISYGEYANPSVVRVSRIAEPEIFSATSGFLITDPSDSTGVRAATEFRKTLYFYKRERGYVTQDNDNEASTWTITNFEKSIGTEPYGIADVMDAKGSSSEGYILASLGALYFFNGVFEEPELSYKIRDLWARINPNYFHLVKVALDPIKKRIYILVPLDAAIAVSHVIYGDYRNGLDYKSIKWSLWQFPGGNTKDIIIYTDLTSNIPSSYTIIGDIVVGMTQLVAGTLTDFPSQNITCNAYLAPTRFGRGISQFHHIIMRAIGPCTITFTAYSEDMMTIVVPQPLVIPSAVPDREYSQLMNLVNEKCRLKLAVSGATDVLDVKEIEILGQELWSERPR